MLFILRVLLCAPQLHTFWVDAENYASVTRPWFASRSPFPLNFLVPGRLASIALSRILLTKGEAPLHRISEVEGKVNIDLPDSSVTCLSCCFQHSCKFLSSQIYSDAKECLNLLSYRLGSANFFFGNSWVLYHWLPAVFCWRIFVNIYGENFWEKTWKALKDWNRNIVLSL